LISGIVDCEGKKQDDHGTRAAEKNKNTHTHTHTQKKKKKNKQVKAG
jgi:hypothetical protein